MPRRVLTYIWGFLRTAADNAGRDPMSIELGVAGRQGYDDNPHGKSGNDHVDFVPDDIVARLCVHGDAKDHIENLEALRDLGVDQFAGYLQHDNKEETLRVYNEQLTPALNGNKAARVQIHLCGVRW